MTTDQEARVGEAIILCGGLASRLQGTLYDRPKALAPVLGRPFIEWLLRSLLQIEGIECIVLATGHMGDMIESQLGNEPRGRVRLTYSREPTPLGTGGAIRRAATQTHSEQILVLNGDTFCRFDMNRLVDSQVRRAAAASIWLSKVDNRGRYGSVSIDSEGRIREFREKSELDGPQLVSAGVYLIDRATVMSIPPDRPVSLEREVFPSLIVRGIYGVVGNTPFVDIGTPESLASADTLLASDLSSLKFE